MCLHCYLKLEFISLSPFMQGFTISGKPSHMQTMFSKAILIVIMEILSTASL